MHLQDIHAHAQRHKTQESETIARLQDTWRLCIIFTSHTYTYTFRCWRSLTQKWFQMHATFVPLSICCLNFSGYENWCFGLFIRTCIGRKRRFKANLLSSFCKFFGSGKISWLSRQNGIDALRFLNHCRLLFCLTLAYRRCSKNGNIQKTKCKSQRIRLVWVRSFFFFNGKRRKQKIPTTTAVERDEKWERTTTTATTTNAKNEKS